MAQVTRDIIQLKKSETGEVFYPETHADAVIGLGTAAKTDSSAYATSTQGSHADDAYNLVKGNKNINTVLAGPASGSAGAASFRKLVENDIPNLSWSKITTDKPTTISGYGITDAKIENGIITLGNSTITPLVSHQTLYNLVISDSSNTVQLTYKPNVNGTYSLKLTKALVGLDKVENTALSTWTGTNKITTVGTITSGVWNGTKIGYNYLGETYIGTTRTQSSSAAQALTGISSIKATSATESLFEWDATNNAWHFKGGIYSDSFVSAGGLSDSSGTSGIDEYGVWTILDATNEVIGVNHIPNITTSKISDLETWIAGKGYVTSSGITSVVKGTDTSGGSVSTNNGVVTIQFPTAYTLPLAASGTRGGIKIGYTQSGKNYPVQLSSEKAYVNVPWTDTTYSTGTSTELNTGTSTETRVWTPKVIADYVTGLISAIDQFHYEIASSTSAVTNPASNILYLIGPTGSGSDKYEEYVYTNTWVKIGDTSIDLSGYQPLDADLTAIAGLSGTSGFLKKTAANTWALDTNTYLTGNQTITLSGDVSGSGTTAIITTIGEGKVTNAMLAGSIEWSKISVTAANIVSKLGNTAVNRATADASGNTITTTYATINALNGVSGRVTTLEDRTNWDTYFGVDASGNVYVKKNGDTARNFYSYGAVSAGGVSDGGGTSGVDLTAVWNNLIANTGEGLNKKIHTAHLPTVTITGTNISGTGTYSGTGGSDSTLTLNLIAVDTKYTNGTGIALSGTTFSLDVAGAKTALGLGSNAYTSTAYLPLAGGEMNATAVISRTGQSVSWYQGRLYPIIKTTSYTGYNAILSMKTTNGSWDLGVYSSDTAYLTYITDENYSAGNNAVTYQLTFPKASGTVALTSQIPTNNNQLTNGAGYLTATTAASTYVKFSQDILDLGATHQMGYGYTTHGWPFSGPAMSFGSGKLTAQIQSNSSGNHLYYRQTVNGTAQSWVEIYHTGNLTQSVVTGLIGSTTYAPYNSAGYLPLNGGTLTGALTILSGNDSKIILDNTDADTNYQGISFRQNGTEYGKLGVFSFGSTNLQWVAGGVINTVIHSGNYSSYALPLTGGTLKSSKRAILYLNEETSSTGVVGPYIGFQVNGTSTAGVGSNSSVGAYLENDNADGHPYVNLDNNGVFKYKNTYTFWHSGNSNLSTVDWACSTLTATNYVLFRNTDNTANAGYVGRGSNSSNDIQLYAFAGGKLQLGANNTTTITIDTAAKVGIGTATPAYKLDVNGTSGWTTRFISTNSVIYAAHNDGYSFYLGSKQSSSSYYLLNLLYGQTTPGTGGTSAFYVRADGNVGIGTTGPAQKLHVVGGARIDSGGSSEGVLQIVSAAGNGSAGYIMFYSNPNQNGFKIASVYSNWASRQDLVFYRSNNETAPYTFTPVELMRLTYNGQVKVTGDIIAYGQILGNSFEFNPSSSAGHGGYIDFHYNGSTADYTSRIIENASGRLAITGQLAVAGAMSCASLTASGNIQANAGATIANNQSYGGLDTGGTRRTLVSIDNTNAAYFAWGNAGAGHNTYVSGNNISFTYGTSHTTGMYLNSSGNVGIGTTIPETKLHVHHTGYPNVILSTTNSEVSIYYRNSSSVYWAAGVGCWGKQVGSTSFSFGVCSGAGSSAYKAYITNTGNFVAVGAITAGSASDVRLKTNIETLSDTDAKTLIMSLRPVTFTWNEKATELYDRYKGDDIGFIAQEVEDIFPVAIGNIFEKYKRLDQTKFIPPIVTVVQNHETRIQNLESENKKLWEENKKLRQQLNIE